MTRDDFVDRQQAVAPQAAGDESLASGPPGAQEAAHSRLVQRLRRRYAAELPLLPPGAPSRTAMRQTYAALREAGHDCGSALRIVRQLVIERLVVLDCERQAPLETVTDAMTELAEVALDIAHDHVMQELSARHGEPLGADGPVSYTHLTLPTKA